MARKKITMVDVATKSGYSLNTVSHVINGKDDVKDETRQRILEAARELGYIRNFVASSMRSGRTRTVAVIVPDVSSVYLSIMVRLLEERFHKHSYSIIIINTNESDELEMNGVETAIGQNVDGVIICPTQRSTRPLELLEQNGIPFVLMGRYFNHHQYESVLMDDFHCGYIATEYLLRLGHKRIFFLNAPSIISSTKERERGYIAAYEDAGLPVCPELIAHFEVNQPCGDIIRRMAEGNPACTAIFAFCDMVAMEIAYHLQALGKSIPEDYSIVGVDNVLSHSYSPFLLTSVDVPKEQMANCLVSTLLRLMRRKNEPVEEAVKQEFYPRLIVRQTTRPLTEQAVEK